MTTHRNWVQTPGTNYTNLFCHIHGTFNFLYMLMHDLRCLVTIFIRLGHLKLQIDRIKLIKCLKHINHFSCQCQIRQKNYVGPSWSKGLRLVIESLLTCEKITTRLGPRQSHDHKHLQWLLHRALFNSHSNTLSLSLSLSHPLTHTITHSSKHSHAFEQVYYCTYTHAFTPKYACIGKDKI